MTTDPAVTKATELGHTVEWDPPAALSAARRWTCTACGSAVIDYNGNIYGSATEITCEALVAGLRRRADEIETIDWVEV
jgi:hypothetical protein